MPLPDHATPDLGDSLAPQEFADDYAQALCDHELRCGFLDESNLQVCLSYHQLDYGVLIGRNYQFDAAAARRCLDALANLDCLPLEFLNCSDSFVPQGRVGQVCDEDCGHGLRCDQTMCPPICLLIPRIPEGTACEHEKDPECADGTYCPWPNGVCTRLGKSGDVCQQGIGGDCAEGLVCQPPGVCGPPGKSGDPCFDDFASYAACTSGLVCQGTGYPNGTCGPFVDEGGECYLSDPCAAGLHCLGYSPTQPGHCTRPVGEGEPCQPPDECRDFTVCQHNVCTRVIRIAGESCDPNADACYPASYCDPKTAVCVPALKLGDRCRVGASFQQCSGNACDPNSGTCVRCQM